MSKLDERINALQEKLKALQEKQQIKERAERQAERQRSRKQENRRKYQLGGLFKLAGISEVDTGALLGALLHFHYMLDDPLRFEEFKRAGDALLAQRERERKETANTRSDRPSTSDDYLR